MMESPSVLYSFAHADRFQSKCILICVFDKAVAKNLYFHTLDIFLYMYICFLHLHIAHIANWYIWTHFTFPLPSVHRSAQPVMRSRGATSTCEFDSDGCWNYGIQNLMTKFTFTCVQLFIAQECQSAAVNLAFCYTLPHLSSNTAFFS